MKEILISAVFVSFVNFAVCQAPQSSNSQTLIENSEGSVKAIENSWVQKPSVANRNLSFSTVPGWEGMVMTVNGLIPADAMGITLPHEHLLIVHKGDDRDLTDEATAISELNYFKTAGGVTLTEMTSIGIGRNPEGLKRISNATGINVIMGSGFYRDDWVADDIKNKSVEELTDMIISDIQNGINGIHSGVIGEIGVSRPRTPFEEKVLIASARAQKATGAAIVVHFNINIGGEAPERHEALDILENAGADLSRVSVSHNTPYVYLADDFISYAQRGCYVAFDMLGMEVNGDVNFNWRDHPLEPAETVKELIDRGYIEHILLSQDLCFTVMYVENGGYGYAHILNNLVPQFRAVGITDDQIHTIMVENPKRLLPFKAYNTQYLNVSPTSIGLGSESGSTGTFNTTSNTSWSISDDADWLSVTPGTGSNNETVTVTATSANTTTSPRAATVTISGTGVSDMTVTVEQRGISTGTSNWGNTDVYGSTSTMANRRAIPVTASEDGTIESLSIYHNGGSGELLMGVYSDVSGSPGSRLGITASATVNSSVGWQTVDLITPVNVLSGQTVWLAFVFEHNPGIRYVKGTPARAQSSATWSGGIPETFGGASLAYYKYSIYCTYSTGTPGPYLNVTPTSFTLASELNSTGTIDISSNTEWLVTDDADWLSVAPGTGSNNEMVTVTATSANTTASPRAATVTISGTGVSDMTVTVEQRGISTGTSNWGNTDVYGSTSTMANRRAIPVTASEDGTIESLSIYHNGGSGELLMGVYSDVSGSPGSRSGITTSTTVNSSAGWQTVDLITPVNVSAGQTVWLAFVFEHNPGIRYTKGTPARAQSTATWSGGMPVTFGGAYLAYYKYSIYCTYSTGTPGPYLNVTPTSITLASESSSTGTIDINSNTEWLVTDDADWLSISPSGGSNDGTFTVQANSANTETSSRSASVTVSGTGVSDKTVTVTQRGISTASSHWGNTDVYGSTSTMANRRAIPVTASEDGTIESLSIYHNGGSGELLMGVYSDVSGSPGSRLGITASATVNSSAGWQTVDLITPVNVLSGQTVWLAWVFENNPGIKYTKGTPARAQSTATWSGGMPVTFGGAYLANYKYSVYCTYSTSGDMLASNDWLTDISEDQENPDDQVLIYPNPTTGKLTVSWEKEYETGLILTLVNLAGQTLEVVVTEPGQMEAKLNLEDCDAGMYFVLLSMKGEDKVVHRSKVVKSR